jgi:uncharacterized protein YqeY
MSIHEQIKKDLTAAIKAKDEDKKNALRVILGEFSAGATPNRSLMTMPSRSCAS